MVHLENLIKKIDDYDRLGNAFSLLKRMAAPSTYTMPDDEEDPEEVNSGEDYGLYSKIINTANQFGNRDIAEELLLIAELYKKALQMNGGYNLVNRALSTTLSNMDSLIDDGTVGEDELEAAEDLLNEVSKDLRQRGKASISSMDEPTAMKELKAVRDAFNQQAVYDEVASQPSVYEKGRPGAETGHNIAPKQMPETPQKYTLEVERLKDLLDNDPSISLNVPPSERGANQNIRNSIQELINNLETLAFHISKVSDLREELKLTPEDPEKRESFIQAANQLEALRKQRLLLKQRLNRFLLTKDKEALVRQMEQTNNLAEKKWLEERIKLQNLRISTDLHKKTEAKYRKNLVNALGTIDEHGNFQSQNVSPETLEKLQAGIAAGEALKKSVKQYDREQTIERAKEHGKVGPVAKRPNRRGGGLKSEKLNAYKTELASYVGLVDKLGEKINTAVHVARLGVTQEKDKTHNALKPYVEVLSKAIQKKDNKAKYEAIKVLKSKMDEWKDRAPAIRVLEKNIRLLPHFNKYKTELQNIGKWQDANGQWQLDDHKRQYIELVIQDIQKLMRIYSRYYTNPGQLELFYDAALDHLIKVVMRLKMDTSVDTTSEKEEHEPEAN